jgi:hypothetical protein
MQPGLARAVPMGIVGFLIGGLIAVVIRLAQGLDPNPEAPLAFVGPVFVLGAFISAGFFVWGMGAFDPKMNVHGEHAEEEPGEAGEEAETPASILRVFTWRVAFWTLLGVLAIGAIAFLPSGPTFKNVHPDQGSVAAVGFVRLGDIYEPTRAFVKTATGLDLLPPMAPNLAAVEVSYLILFIVFFAWTLLSLFVAAGLIAFIINYFARGKADPQSTPIPWRALIFVGVVAGLIQLPLLISGGQVPMALLAPFYVLPPILYVLVYPSGLWILLLIAALALAAAGGQLLAVAFVFLLVLLSLISKNLRNILWVGLILLTLNLPLLVSVVGLAQIPATMLVLIAASLIALASYPARHVLAAGVWRGVFYGLFTLMIVLTLVVTISNNRTDFWALLFYIVIIGLSIGLIMPVDYLKAIVPAEAWQRAASLEWGRLIPSAAAWLARLLRRGLPSFLGQK